MCAHIHVRDPGAGYVWGGSCLAARLRHVSCMGADYRSCQGLFSSAAVEDSHPQDLVIPTKSSVLRFTATEAVRSDPADDKHKPGLIFWGLRELQSKQDPWHGSCTEEGMSSPEILMKWHLKKKKKTLSYVRKNQWFSLFYPIYCKLHIDYR